MPRKSENPVTTIVGFAITPDEMRALDALVRAMRMQTGEPVTRSSFLRALVVERVAAVPNP